MSERPIQVISWVVSLGLPLISSLISYWSTSRIERIEDNIFAGWSRLDVDDGVGDGYSSVVSKRLACSGARSWCYLSLIIKMLYLVHKRIALLGSPHGAAVLGNFLMRELLSDEHRVTASEEGGWAELPLWLADVEAEADDDDQEDDENEAEDPHEEDLGGVAPVSDGGGPLSIESHPNRNWPGPWRNSRVLNIINIADWSKLSNCLSQTWATIRRWATWPRM